jgi:hypothetical protein
VGADKRIRPWAADFHQMELIVYVYQYIRTYKYTYIYIYIYIYINVAIHACIWMLTLTLNDCQRKLGDPLHNSTQQHVYGDALWVCRSSSYEPSPWTSYFETRCTHQR